MTRKSPLSRSWLATRLRVEQCEDRAVPAGLDGLTADTDIVAVTDGDSDSFDGFDTRSQPTAPAPLAQWLADEAISGSGRLLDRLNPGTVPTIGNLFAELQDRFDRNVRIDPVSIFPKHSKFDDVDPIDVKPTPTPMPPHPVPADPTPRGTNVDLTPHEDAPAPPRVETVRDRPKTAPDATVPPPIAAQALATATPNIAAGAETAMLAEGDAAIPEAAPVAAEPSVTESTLHQFAESALSFALPGIDAAGLISRLAPFDTDAVEESIDRFLDRLREGREDGQTWLSNRQSGLLSIAVAAGLTAGEVARRKRVPQRIGQYLSLGRSNARTRTKS